MVVGQAPVSVAVFAVFVISQPKIVAQVETTFVVVVMVPETPKDVVVAHIDAVSVSHPPSGSEGNVGSPSRPILSKIISSLLIMRGNVKGKVERWKEIWLVLTVI